MVHALREVDTVVMDDPDTPPRRRPGRSAIDLDEAGDLTMQVKLDDGAWHTKMIGGFRTRCDQPINYRLVLATRVETYDTDEGPLCTRGCFSPPELELAAAIAHARKDD